MKELLNFILQKITGKDDFEITESEEEGKITLEVQILPEDMGLVIGKGGNTIKAIQTLLRVKGRIENKFVDLNVREKEL
jgi:uncharacterized protein